MMSIRGWARSRGIPSSTAHKAVTSGRITAGADGVDPEVADLEWRENTRPRIDGRVPVAPVATIAGIPAAALLRWRDLAPILDENDRILQDELFAAVDRVAPTLVGLPVDDLTATLRAAIHDALGRWEARVT